jgi:DNA-binding transcriptional ArsR family regulator
VDNSNTSPVKQKSAFSRVGGVKPLLLQAWRVYDPADLRERSHANGDECIWREKSMLEENVSDLTPQAEKEVPTRRPPEIDAFVDHFLSMMCETSRRQIIEMLSMPKSDKEGSTLERRSTDIARELGLSFSTTSEHLKRLTNLGLLGLRRDGNAVYYRIKNLLLVKAFHELLRALDKHYDSSGSNTPRQSNKDVS